MGEKIQLDMLMQDSTMILRATRASQLAANLLDDF